MEVRDWITVIALIAGPTLAVGLTLYAQKRASDREGRINLFKTLLACRQDLLNPERIKALCLIDFVFHDVPSVRAKWKEYFDALSDPQYNDGQNNAFDVWTKRQNVMIAAMAKNLGYGDAIGVEEINRSYAPKQYVSNAESIQTTQRELLRLLQNSENFGAPRNTSSAPDTTQPTPP